MADIINAETVKRELVKYGFKPLFEEYINNNQALEVEDYDGYKYVTTWARLRKNGVPACIVGTHNKYSKHNINLWLKLNNIDLYLNYDKDEGCSPGENLEFLTSDGYKILKRFDNIRLGKLQLRVFAKSNPFSEYNIKLWLKINSPNYIFDSCEGYSSEDSVYLHDIDGYKYTTKWGELITLSPLKKISTHNKYTINNIKLWLSLNKKDYELISNNYSGCRENLIWKCNIHNVTFDMCWSQMQLKARYCPLCGVDLRSGENNISWNGGISTISEYLRDKIQSWKQDSFKRFEYRCCITNEKDKKQIIHHLYNFSDIVKESISTIGMDHKKIISEYEDYELELLKRKCIELHYKYGLGVCISNYIHDEFHSLYGKSNNTPQQFYEFYKLKTGKDFIDKAA